MKLTCFRISNGGLFGEKLPERIKILDWGDNPNVKDVPVRVTKRTLTVLPAAQKAAGFDFVALDYEHNTVKGSPEYERTQEPRKVAGYGVPEVVDGQGLFLTNMAYTPSGIENAREYIDLSPAVERDEKTGEVLFIHSAALCRQGAVEDLHFFNVEVETQKGANMDELKTQLDALSAAVAELKARLDAPVNPETLAAIQAKIGEIEGALITMKTDFQSELARRDKESLVAAAAAAGKFVDPKVVETLSVTDLKAHIEKLAATVPVSRRTPTHIRENAERASLIEQFNAIRDPAKRAEFYAANRAKFFSNS